MDLFIYNSVNNVGVETEIIPIPRLMYLIYLFLALEQGYDIHMFGLANVSNTNYCTFVLSPKFPT